MSSLAIPTAVVAVVPGAAIAQTGQSAGSLAPEANAVGFGDGTTGGEGFAVLLGRQIASAALPADLAAVAVSTEADQPVAAPTDVAVMPVDLSVLLQGLLLPMSASAPRPPNGEPDSTSLAAQTASLPQGYLPGAVETDGSTQPLPNLAMGSSPLGDDSPDFAELIADDAKRAVADAAVAGKTAESAARELPLQAAQPELQPAAPMVSHAPMEARSVERESMVVSTPVTTPTWHEDIGGKVTMLIGKEATSAELVLTPPHLGRVEVQLSVNGDQTSATFVAATPAAREALEQALPKLREFLADAGINLTQASVGGDAQAGQGNGDGARGSRSGRGGTSGSVIEVALPAAAMRRIDGMVDTFA